MFHDVSVAERAEQPGFLHDIFNVTFDTNICIVVLLKYHDVPWFGEGPPHGFSIPPFTQTGGLQTANRLRKESSQPLHSRFPQKPSGAAASAARQPSRLCMPVSRQKRLET